MKFKHSSKNKYCHIGIITIIIFSALLSCKKKPDGELTKKQINALKHEIEFGRIITAEILNRNGAYHNPKVQKYINLVGKSLAIYVGRPEINYHFAVINNNSLLCLSLPGGYILISKGLIKALNTEEELAGVFAHEINHINERHLLNKIFDSKTSRTFSQKLEETEKMDENSKAKAYGEMLEKAIHILLSTGFSKTQEFAADEFAFQSLHSIGYNADGMIDFLKILQTLEQKIGKAKVFPNLPPARIRLAKLLSIKEKNNIKGGKKIVSRFQKIKKSIK